jgi:phytanoyl-CoA hydroxylase
MTATTPDPCRDFNADGYLVFPGFFDAGTVAAAVERAWQWVDSHGTPDRAAVFSSSDRGRSADAALFASAEAVHCFYETEAVGADGRLQRPPRRAVNKIGHALHDLDPVFDRLSRDRRLAALASALGLARPLLWQGQVVFKPPGVGGEVRWHQDASYFDTTPQTVTTFWVALEDATRDNGCLWVAPGGHRGPLRERFVRQGDRLRREALDPAPWPDGSRARPLEVAAGTLVVLHGLLPHGSAANRSDRSRLAFTLHVTDGRAAYSPGNWLQRSPRLPVRGF